MKIDIIVVNWNTGNYLKECVKSLIDYNDDCINRIIIIDNNSSDNSIENLPNNSLLKVIKEKKNHGFGKACNIGAKYSSQNYLLFLNPDTKIFPGTLKNNIDFMEKSQNSNIAICGAKMVDINDNTVNSCSRFPSVSRIFFKSTGLENLFKDKGMLMRNFNHDESLIVDQIIGAFFLIRREVFTKLNGFDERFFLYMEEVDLSYRTYLLGLKSYYNSETKCFHRGGVSSDNDKVLRQFNYLKSRVLYSKKNFNFLDHFFTLFLTIFVEFFSRLLVSFLKFSINDIKTLIKSYFYLINWFIFGKQ